MNRLITGGPIRTWPATRATNGPIWSSEQLTGICVTLAQLTKETEPERTRAPMPSHVPVAPLFLRHHDRRVALLERLLPAPACWTKTGGRPEKWHRREIVDA